MKNEFIMGEKALAAAQTPILRTDVLEDALQIMEGTNTLAKRGVLAEVVNHIEKFEGSKYALKSLLRKTMRFVVETALQGSLDADNLAQEVPFAQMEEGEFVSFSSDNFTTTSHGNLVMVETLKEGSKTKVTFKAFMPIGGVTLDTYNPNSKEDKATLCRILDEKFCPK